MKATRAEPAIWSRQVSKEKKATTQWTTTKVQKALAAFSRREVVAVDAAYFRPTEVELLIGDPTKSIEKLGWKIKYDLPMLVQDMMTSDIKLFKKERALRELGYAIKNQYE
ncbi:MAG: hypothetical protein EON56_00520 [Alphaproteobacteria bacterium]|nr:MAG: hypothetical protein EON56_00520 [Alphaproteobacteria bacterium]